MPTVSELKKQRAARLDDAKAVKRSAEIQARDLTDIEFAAIEKAVGEAKELETQITAQEQREATLAALDAQHGELDSYKAKTGPKAAERVTVKAGWESDPNRGFKAPRDFLTAVLRAGQRPEARVPENLESLRIKASVGSDEQSTYSDPYGGFAVPEGMSPNLLQVASEVDPIAGRTTNVPMDTPSIRVNARVDKDHSTSVSGGLRVYRRAEAETVTASKMEMEQIKLEADSLMGLCYSTEELLRDSPRSFAALIAAGFGDEFRSRLCKERLRGSGVGEYLGVLNSPALVTISKESGQTAATINGSNLIKMRAQCWRYSEAIWLANHDTLPSLVSAHIALTNASVPLFAPADQEDRPDMILGRPVYFVEDASTLGTVGDIVLGNWSQYLESTYQPLESAESIHVRFVNNERAFRFWVRNAGAPWWRTALTPKKSSKTLSPFVTLETRS